MRYVSVKALKEGMILAQSVHGSNGDLLVRNGVAMSPFLIKKLQNMGYSGLYIQDEFSDGIQITDVISDEIRNSSMKAARSIMLNAVSGEKGLIRNDLKELMNQLKKIIDSVLSSEQSVMNVMNIKSFDLYTYQHSVNVCVLSTIIGISYGLSYEQLQNLAITSILHDMGKSFIDKNILNKVEPLTEDESNTIKKHSTLGYIFIRDKCTFTSSVCIGTLMHHERYDGSGYPYGRKGNDIPLFAQIIAVADVYDAMISERPYRPPISPHEAYEYVIGNSGKHFNPKIVEIFSKRITPFPEGFNVLLSNGVEGIVYKNHEDLLTRPIIKIDAAQDKEAYFIDLKNDPRALEITIKKIIV